jgi:hypothetical protein
VPFAGWHKTELKKWAFRKIKNAKVSAMSVGPVAVPMKHVKYVVGHLIMQLNRRCAKRELATVILVSNLRR